MFLYPHKAYDTLDGGRILQTLDGYGVRPKMQRIWESFWENQEVVTKQNGYHGLHFRATHSTTQRGVTFSTLFNAEIDSVVCYWLFMTVEDEAIIQYGLGHILV